MSGAQGASYNSNSGGCGVTLSGRILLSYGDVLTFDVTGTKPSYSKSGSTITVPGGPAAKLKRNGTVIWIASGGPGQRSLSTAETGVNSVVLQGGVGNTTGTAETCSVHWCPETESPKYAESNPGAPCYVGDKHTHNKTGTCPYHMGPKCGASVSCIWHLENPETNDCKQKCSAGHEMRGSGHYSSCPHQSKVWDCGSPINTWKYACTVGNGTIVGGTSGGYGSNYIASGYSATSSTDNYDGCKATIRLSTQYNTSYTNVTVYEPRYADSVVNLIVKENAVCYYKRR